MSFTLMGSTSTYRGPNRSSSKSFVSFSKFATVLLKIFISNQVSGTRKCDSNNRIRSEDKEKEGSELGRFSNDSSITGGNTFSHTEMDTESVASPSIDATCEIVQGRVITQWRPVEENNQHSPVSVLDTTDSVQNIPAYNGYGNELSQQEQEKPSASKNKIQKKVSEDLILSASMWELVISSQKHKTKQSSRTELLPQLINAKKLLQETRQLLFDCVREVVENKNKNQRKNTRKKQKGLMTGSEEIGKIICNNVETWGVMRLSNDETSLKKVLRMDLMSSFEEEQWSDFEACKKAIAFEIGDEILSDLIYQF